MANSKEPPQCMREPGSYVRLTPASDFVAISLSVYSTDTDNCKNPDSSPPLT